MKTLVHLTAVLESETKRQHSKLGRIGTAVEDRETFESGHHRIQMNPGGAGKSTEGSGVNWLLSRREISICVQYRGVESKVKYVIMSLESETVNKVKQRWTPPGRTLPCLQ